VTEHVRHDNRLHCSIDDNSGINEYHTGLHIGKRKPILVNFSREGAALSLPEKNIENLLFTITGRKKNKTETTSNGQSN